MQKIHNREKFKIVFDLNVKPEIHNLIKYDR